MTCAGVVEEARAGRTATGTGTGDRTHARKEADSEREMVAADSGEVGWGFSFIGPLGD